MNPFDWRPRGFVPSISPWDDDEPATRGFGLLDDDELAGASSEDYLVPTASRGLSNRRPWPIYKGTDSLFDRFWQAWSLEEGGYADRRGDPGGPTNMGMSQAARDLAEKKYWGAPKDVKDMTLPQIQGYLFQEHYALPRVREIEEIVGSDPTNAPLAHQIFDISGMHRSDAAGKWLQEALNAHLQRTGSKTKLGVDGVIGSKTLDALREAKSLNLIPAINDTIVNSRTSNMRKNRKLVNNPGWISRAKLFASGQ